MANYDVVWDADAAREFKQLQRRHQKSVARVATRRGDDPWGGDVKTIQDADGLLRARVGEYRLIYHVDEPEQRVLILAVMPRRDEYPQRYINRWLERRERFFEGQ